MAVSVALWPVQIAVLEAAIVGVAGAATPVTVTVVTAELPTPSVTTTVKVCGPAVPMVADTTLAEVGLTVVPAGPVQVKELGGIPPVTLTERATDVPKHTAVLEVVVVRLNLKPPLLKICGPVSPLIPLKGP